MTTKRALGILALLLAPTGRVAAADGDGAAAAAAPRPPAPFARVTLELDASSRAVFEIHNFDLTLGAATGGRGRPRAGAGAELRLNKRAGVHSGTLAAAAASARLIPHVLLEAFDAAGAPTMALHIYDATVVTDHIVLSPTRVVLEQQLLSLQEWLTQLASDLQDAQRQQAAAEALGKTRAASALDLTRARERTAELAQRLSLAKQRHALLGRQVESQGELEEEITLHVGRVEIEASGTGGRGSWGRASVARP